MASTTLKEAAAALMVLLADNISGLRGAPSEPPESINQFPFAVAWPGSGSAVGDSTPGTYRLLPTLVLEVHVARLDLPTDMEAIYPYLEYVLDVILDPDNLTISGNVDTIVFDDDSGGIAFEFGRLDWGDDPGTKTLGWRFTIPVKLRRTIS